MIRGHYKMDKIGHFNLLNRTNLQTEHLLCAGCEDWLLTNTYHSSNGLNYCEVCSAMHKKEEEDITTSLISSHLLEVLLKNFKYPCKYCDFVGIASELMEHVKVCLHRPLKCLFCDMKGLHEFNIVKHLSDNHSSKVISMEIEERNAILTLEIPFAGNKLFIFNYKDNYFIVNVELVEGMLSFLIAQQAIAGNSSISNVTVQFESGYTKTTLNVKVRQIKSIIERHTGILKEKLNLQNNENNIEIKIDFMEYGKVVGSIDECPICFYSLTTEMYQCRNGHSVCTGCKEKINTCPTCRLPIIDQRISLKNILSSYYFPCKNADAGCLHVAKLNDMTYHQIDCVYRKETCVNCNESYMIHKMIDHMTEQHQIYPNFQFFSGLFHKNEELNCYLRYKNCIFRFSIVYKNSREKTLSFNVRLLHCLNNKVAEKFRYEIHIQNHNKNVLGKVGNVCQITSNDKFSSTIDLICCEKYVLQNDFKIWNLRYRFHIFEIDMMF